MRRVFQDHMFGQFRLESHSMLIQFVDHTIRAFRPEDADEHVSVFEIGRDIDVVDGNARGIKAHFSSDNSAKLALNQLVYAQKSMFHENRRGDGVMEQGSNDESDQHSITPLLHYSSRC